MKRNFESVLDDCLRFLRSGGDVDACLARYPEYAPELRPLLQLATDLYAVDIPTPDEPARQTARQRMLAAVRKRHDQTIPATFFSSLLERSAPKKRTNGRLVRRFATLVPVILLIMLTGVVTVGASRSSLPGDALYPVKLTTQRARMVLTLDRSKRDALIQQVGEERRQDIQSALQGDREAKVQFDGVLQQLAKGVWVVGGLSVSLDGETVVRGEPVIGAKVSVRGRLPGDGTLLAVSLIVGESDDVLLSPLPTPSATPEPTETEEPDDSDDLTSEPVVTDELEDDDYVGTPEAIETGDPDDSDDATPEMTETDEPESDDDGTLEPDETDEPDEDESATIEPGGTEESEPEEASQPTETDEPDDDDDSTPPSSGTEEPDDDGTATPVPSGTEEPDDEETPEPSETDEPDDDDDETPESTREPED
jgi:hypothetical protein